MEKTEKEKEYHAYEAEVLAMPPLRMVLVNIPEPDPVVMNSRNEQIIARKAFFQNSDLLERLIKHMVRKE